MATPKPKMGNGKVEKVMREYASGQLNVGKSTKKVTSKKQAVAIALSEQRKKDASKKKKKKMI